MSQLPNKVRYRDIPEDRKWEESTMNVFSWVKYHDLSWAVEELLRGFSEEMDPIRER